VPYLWLVDPEARTIEALTLQDDRYVLAIGATDPDPVALPPFATLRLVPDTLWP
jgi:hypothetical protein